jgi:ABC transporter with metal-binding/Fe-S-binding domain ATP-binding protein
MKVAALFSGGKDSVFAVYIAKQWGWDITHLIAMISKRKDSWMFHTVNIHLTDLLSDAINIPLLTMHTKGEKEDELIDLKDLLDSIDIDGVISGAIASEYQRTRIERICHELGINSYTPIWHKNQKQLISNQIDAGFVIKIVGVHANGFDESWLGKTIDNKTLEELVELNKKFSINIAGEGGEFETLVIDGPIFNRKLILDETEKSWHRDNGTLMVKKAHLE